MNRKSWRNKYLQQNGPAVITKQKKKHKYYIFFKTISEGKNKIFSNTDSNDHADAQMLMPRFLNGC